MEAARDRGVKIPMRIREAREETSTPAGGRA
jgi:hypothetical protein